MFADQAFPPRDTTDNRQDAIQQLGLHPAIECWFTQTFAHPTATQLEAWAAIAAGQHSLIAAPTGSGKTLAAFVPILNQLVCNPPDPSSVAALYISPLKALSNDINANLKAPITAITALLNEGSESPPPLLSIGVRNGDTPAHERQSMIRRPPQILATTPESLYLLLTAKRGREILRRVRYVVVDELHAVAADKRGSHLLLSLERLALLSEQPLQRIGISATQKPIETMAQFLVGSLADSSPDSSAPTCRIINAGYKREMRLSIAVPDSPLTAVIDGETWQEIFSKIAELAQTRRTTLVFVNTRRLAERAALKLRELLGTDQVASHHGSLSHARRLEAEQRLKDGKLQVLVATASLELGLDIGAIELVCQIASPRSIATFLQRAGRAGHSLEAIPEAILFPTSLEDLVECAALLDAIRKEELDQPVIPQQPLDILAQQIVAEVASCDEQEQHYNQQQLYQSFTRAYPYRNLSFVRFVAVLGMLAEGFTFRNGRRNAYLYRNPLTGELRARKGARLTAITCGGAIPDTFEYDVALETSGTVIGKIDEEFGFESMIGDIFQLGNTSWQIVKKDLGTIFVRDAGDAPPSIPFWIADAPGRSDELSAAVSRFRQHIGALIGSIAQGTEDYDASHALHWLEEHLGLVRAASEQIVDYLGSSLLSLGAIPTQQHLITERFFDETGDMHLVFHLPYGMRMNRAFGLALRKKFCRNFNFELQAAANDNAVILSLGSTHSFPLEQTFSFLRSPGVEDTLVQALLDSPMFETRWRHNASRALAIKRSTAGKKTPPQFQRMNAEDLIALIFPDQLACLENIIGERDIPEHPLIEQTIDDCVNLAMDVKRLRSVLQSIESGAVMCTNRELNAPSPLAQDIIAAKNYAFLDPAPAEERRTLAIQNAKLSPSAAAAAGRLSPQDFERLRAEAFPGDIADQDDLCDALLSAGYCTCDDVAHRLSKELIHQAEAEGRVCCLHRSHTSLWIVPEYLPKFHAIYAHFQANCSTAEQQYSLTQNGNPMDPAVVEHLISLEQPTFDQALAAIVQLRIAVCGVISAAKLAQELGISPLGVETALALLESRGSIFQGTYLGQSAGVQWCERHALHRLRKQAQAQRRSRFKAVSMQAFCRFLFAWQGVERGEREDYLEQIQAAGVQQQSHAEPSAAHQSSLADILRQLSLYEAPALAWDSHILPLRVPGYSPTQLDTVGSRGAIGWGRLSPSKEGKNSSVSRLSPVTFFPRADSASISTLRQATVSDSTVMAAPQEKQGHTNPSLSKEAQRVCETLQEEGALFFEDLQQLVQPLASMLERTLTELVAAGLITCDSFAGLRALMLPEKRKMRHGYGVSRQYKAFLQAGRWSLLQQRRKLPPREEAVEQVARIFLRRYGVLFRKLLQREPFSPPWRELRRALHLLELRGEVLYGHFVQGQAGEQFALPEAIAPLRRWQEQQSTELITISAVDPLNLSWLFQGQAGGKGLSTPIPARPANTIIYQNGLFLFASSGGEFRELMPLNADARVRYEALLCAQRSADGGIADRQNRPLLSA